VFVKSVAELPAALPPVLQDGDLLLTLGAGDIGNLPQLLQRPLSPRRGERPSPPTPLPQAGEGRKARRS
jgi:hypothetical protein